MHIKSMFYKFTLFVFFSLSSLFLIAQKPIKGSLLIEKDFNYKIKDYNIVGDAQTQIFSITKNDKSFTASKYSFVQAAIGKETVEEAKGSFFIDDKIIVKFDMQTIENTKRYRNDSLIIEGKLLGKKEPIDYQFCLKIQKNNTVSFYLTIENEKINRLFLTFDSEKTEYLYGMGEQFTHLNMNGEYVPCFISEQGIGRGKQPITALVNMVAKSGGTEFTTYAAIPFFFSNKMYSFSLNNTEYSGFDFRNDDFWQVRCFTNNFQGQFYIADNYQQIITENAERNGLMRPLPDWFHKGAIIGMQGGTEKVVKIYNDLKKHGTPISGFWLQDWVGQRITSFGKQLWWNWQLDKSHYPNWPYLSEEMKNDKVPLLVYINPFLVDVSHNPKHKVNLFEIAEKKGFLVKNPEGETYLIPNTDFSAGIIDLTNPKAVKWFKDIVVKYVATENVKGWMADFGEALPYDAVLYSGESATEYHNKYPVEWVKLNREIIDEMPNGDEIVFFSRAGFANSSKYATMFWEGDQLVSWDEYDGIKSAVVGLLSSGLSGMPLNHSDIGGYTGIANPLAKNIRSKELLWRWIELNAFSPIFRTHEGNLPDDNYQFYTDQETMIHFTKYAKIFSYLFDYRKELLANATKSGIPPVRPMFLEFPKDKYCYEIEYEQFMFGNEFLVAPILDKRKNKKEVYLPKGEWFYLWNNKKYSSNGVFVKVETELGEIPVFYKENSKYGNELFEKIQKF